jgi:hypothetical protein
VKASKISNGRARFSSKSAKRDIEDSGYLAGDIEYTSAKGRANVL